MKNLVILFTLLAAALAPKAQITYIETRADVVKDEQRMNADRKKIRDNHIRSAKTYNYKTQEDANAGKGNLAQEFRYDEQGNLVEYKWFNKRGKMKYHYTYAYDEQNRWIEFASPKPNGEMLYKYTYTYDAAGNNTDIREFIKNPDYAYWHSHSTFDEKQNILELKYFTKNDTKAGTKYVYSYYPDGSKKMTEQYDRKGRVRHTWNYDCNPSGALITKNLKDTSKICIRYETDKDGNLVKIKEENVKQGSIVRIVSKYDKNDNIIDRIQYDENGKAKYHYAGAFDEKNNETESITYNCKTNTIKERFVYKYDTNGNLAEAIAYKKSTEPDHILKYNYTGGQ